MNEYDESLNSGSAVETALGTVLWIAFIFGFVVAFRNYGEAQRMSGSRPWKVAYAAVVGSALGAFFGIFNFDGQPRHEIGAIIGGVLSTVAFLHGFNSSPTPNARENAGKL